MFPSLSLNQAERLAGKVAIPFSIWKPAGLFPNLLISAHPDYVLTHRLEPLAPGLTRVTCDWLFDPEPVAEEDFDPSYAVDFWDLTNRQDWRACEAVQRGAGNLGYRPGPLSTRESTVYQFLSMVARGYLDGVLAPPVFVARPEAGYQDSDPGSPLKGPTMSSVTQPP
jgi:phenylpropionate dioxygenase-like ring-hydroxylating dioxygenase large terminal subunit